MQPEIRMQRLIWAWSLFLLLFAVKRSLHFFDDIASCSCKISLKVKFLWAIEFYIKEIYLVLPFCEKVLGTLRTERTDDLQMFCLHCVGDLNLRKNKKEPEMS